MLNQLNHLNSLRFYFVILEFLILAIFVNKYIILNHLTLVYGLYLLQSEMNQVYNLISYRTNIFIQDTSDATYAKIWTCN